MIRNLQRAVRLNVADLQRFAEKALNSCRSIRRKQATQLRCLRQISVLVISDRRMAALHQQFLDTAGPTDVITFEHGEIFISVDTAKRHARTYRTSLGHELRLYIVHALLHLHGFDDQKTRDAQRMEAMQNMILKQIAEG
jgi:rRNA maturation RNase YbeY